MKNPEEMKMSMLCKKIENMKAKMRKRSSSGERSGKSEM